MAATANPLKVVICGGGVVGCSIAYHLTQLATPERDVDVLVLECVEIACAASGKAGGFLAYDWCGGSALGDLAKKSFKLHAELATKLGVDYGYRKLDTLSVKASAKNKEGGPVGKESPEWLDGPGVFRGRTHGILGSTETTAQVHPYHFTKALIEEAQKTQKAKVRIAKVVSIAYKEGTDTIVGVNLSNGEVVPADAVVIAMGPWSGHIQLAPGDRRGLPVSGTRAHSIVIQPSKPVTPHAIFLDYKTRAGVTSDPEIYPRPDGQVYVCGMSDDEVLPTNPAEARPGEGKCEALLEVAKTVSSFLDVPQPLVQQACYLPVSKDGRPIIGKIPIGEYNGSKVYVATGHSCWGILNSPATGLAIAELVLKGASTTVDISSFDPARFFK